MIFIFCQGYLHALDTQSTLNIYHEIFSSLVDNRKIIVYTKDKELRQVFKHSNQIELSDSISHATIILLSSKEDLAPINALFSKGGRLPIVFTTKYKLLKESHHIIGAFYWKKGRSQLLFIKNRLDKHQIYLPEKYRSFIVDEL